VTDAGLKELAGLRSLQGLYLNRTRVTDAGLKELWALKRLRELSLGRTKVTDAGLNDLKQIQKLQFLSLTETQVTNAGLKELNELKDLCSLDLSWTQVTDAGLMQLTGLKKLNRLNLWGTAVTDAGVKAIEEALPGVWVDRRKDLLDVLRRSQEWGVGETTVAILLIALLLTVIGLMLLKHASLKRKESASDPLGPYRSWRKDRGSQEERDAQGADHNAEPPLQRALPEAARFYSEPFLQEVARSYSESILQRAYSELWKEQTEKK
jgi:hypothetical protein